MRMKTAHVHPAKCNLAHWLTRHGSPTTYRRSALPQMLYRLRHRFGIFWIPPRIDSDKRTARCAVIYWTWVENLVLWLQWDIMIQGVSFMVFLGMAHGKAHVLYAVKLLYRATLRCFEFKVATFQFKNWRNIYEVMYAQFLFHARLFYVSLLFNAPLTTPLLVLGSLIFGLTPLGCMRCITFQILVLIGTSCFDISYFYYLTIFSFYWQYIPSWTLASPIISSTVLGPVTYAQILCTRIFLNWLKPHRLRFSHVSSAFQLKVHFSLCLIC
jgi:hypothetical protein